MSGRRQAARARQRQGLQAEQHGVAIASGGAVGAWAGDGTEFPGGESVPTSGTAYNRWYRPLVRDAASETMRALPLQRGVSRELARGNPIAAGAIQTNVDRVVGTGLALVAAPARQVLGWSEDQALEWKRLVQGEFSLWSDSPECDWAGELNFYDLQGLTLRAMLESGDCFTVLPDGTPSASQPYRLRLQTLEADRVGNPGGVPDGSDVIDGDGRARGRVSGGISRRAAGGVADAYFVYAQHPGASTAAGGDRWAGQWVERVGPTSGRRRILHHFRPLRPEQPRGIPYLAPIVGHLHQLGRYTEAELKAAVVTALMTVFVESESGAGGPPIFNGAEQGGTTAPPGASTDIPLGSGAVVGLAPGEKVTLVDPTRPASGFDPFVRAILQQIGMALGLPLEVLAKKFDASYSASRAALLDASVWFRGLRTLIARSYCQPIYETWLAEAVASGRVPAPGFFRDPMIRWAYTRAGWHGDSVGSLNPKDEVAAYTAAIDARLMTRERAQWELFGDDWNESFGQKLAEQQRLAENGMLPVPKAGAAAPQQQQTGADAGAPPSEPVAATQPAAPPSFTFNVAPPSVTVGPPSVTIHQGDIAVHTPEAQIQLEAHIEPPDVTVQAPVVNVEVPPAQVTVQTVQQPTRQVITRDADGEIASIETVPVGTTH